MKNAIYLIFLLVIGCATQNNNQSLQQENKRIINARYERLKNDEVVKLISNKIWLDDIKNAPLSYFVNSEYSNSTEKQSINRLNELMQISNAETEKFVLERNLPLTDLMRLSFSANSALLVDLYNEKITYGEYATKKRDMSTYFDMAVIQRSNQVAAIEQQRRDAAYVNLQNYLMNQNLVNSLNQPARISPFSCSKLGQTINCW